MAANDEDSVLRVEIRNMSENIAHMRAAVDDMSKELKKIGILEERHVQQAAALDRAFTEIDEVSKKQEESEKATSIKFAYFDKVVWFGSGILAAISVLWTIFGVYVAQSVKETLSVASEYKIQMRLHDRNESGDTRK